MFFFFQAEDGIRDIGVTGVQTCALPISLPIWVGVGGTPESFVRAGLLGLPLMVAIIGGEPRQFAPLVDLYPRGRGAGRPPPPPAPGGGPRFFSVAGGEQAAPPTTSPPPDGTAHT